MNRSRNLGVTSNEIMSPVFRRRGSDENDDGMVLSDDLNVDDGSDDQDNRSDDLHLDELHVDHASDDVIRITSQSPIPSPTSNDANSVDSSNLNQRLGLLHDLGNSMFDHLSNSTRSSGDVTHFRLSMSVEVGDDIDETFLRNLDATIGIVPRGYSEEQIDTIPVKSHVCDEGEICTICRENIDTGAEVRDIPCGHIYHKECLDTSLKDDKRCPLCRAEITVSSQIDI